MWSNLDWAWTQQDYWPKLTTCGILHQSGNHWTVRYSNALSAGDNPTTHELSDKGVCSQDISYPAGIWSPGAPRNELLWPMCMNLYHRSLKKQCILQHGESSILYLTCTRLPTKFECLKHCRYCENWKHTWYMPPRRNISEEPAVAAKRANVRDT